MLVMLANSRVRCGAFEFEASTCPISTDPRRPQTASIVVLPWLCRSREQYRAHRSRFTPATCSSAAATMKLVTVRHFRRAASSIRRLASSGNRIENEAVYGPSNSASVSSGNFNSALDLTECIV